MIEVVSQNVIELGNMIANVRSYVLHLSQKWLLKCNFMFTLSKLSLNNEKLMEIVPLILDSYRQKKKNSPI